MMVHWTVRGGGRYTTDPPLRAEIHRPKKPVRVYKHLTQPSMDRLLSISDGGPYVDVDSGQIEISGWIIIKRGKVHRSAVAI